MPVVASNPYLPIRPERGAEAMPKMGLRPQDQQNEMNLPRDNTHIIMIVIRVPLKLYKIEVFKQIFLDTLPGAKYFSWQCNIDSNSS